MPRAWRLVKRRHAAAAFSGEGARLFPGRWNSAGRRAVYVSESPALAALELLVHLEDAGLLSSYVSFEVEIPDAEVERVDLSLLPEDWAASPARPETRALGDEWLASKRSLALRVPSAVVEGSNFVLNPEHPAFADLAIPEPKPFRFDPRLR